MNKFRKIHYLLPQIVLEDQNNPFRRPFQGCNNQIKRLVSVAGPFSSLPVHPEASFRNWTIFLPPFPSRGFPPSFSGPTSTPGAPGDHSKELGQCVCGEVRIAFRIKKNISSMHGDG